MSLDRIYPPSQQIYICDPPRIYPSLPEYTTPYSTTIILCDAPGIYPPPPKKNIPPFLTTIYDTPRIYSGVDSSRFYSPFQQIYMCGPPRIFPSLPEYTIPLFNNYMRHSPESTTPSQNISPFSTIKCDRPDTHPFNPLYPCQIITKQLYLISGMKETVISDIRDEGDIVYLINTHRNVTSLYLFLIQQGLKQPQ